MNERPWATPSRATAIVFSILFWLGFVIVAITSVQPNLAAQMDGRSRVWLYGFGVFALIAAMVFTVQSIRKG